MRKAGADTALQTAQAPAGCRIALSVHRTIAEVADEWRRFQRQAAGTLYQNVLWCEAWTETIGAAHGVSPVIVIGREAGQIRFLLPLQIARRQGVRVLEWLGAPHHNYGFPLLDRSAPQIGPWFADGLARILAAVGGFDAVALTENPHLMAGIANPLAPHFTAAGANLSFAMALSSDFKRLFEAHSDSERRRSLRKKEELLGQSGSLYFGLPESPADLHGLIDTMFRDQEQRLAELGVHDASGPNERRFIHRLASGQDPADPILAPYHLKHGDKVLAVMLGGIYGGTYWALISSLAQGPERRFSPGDIALCRTIAACCARGLTRFDFSAGDAAYKRQWAEERIETSVILQAANLRGLAWAAGFALRLAVKRAIKRSPRLLPWALWLRRLLFARR